MLLTTRILAETQNCTISALSIDRVFFGFICEDGYRETKVPDETRIPGGRYQIKPRFEGKFFSNYKKRFGHEFALHLQDVPNFTFILIHIGNGPGDSRGCLLVGRSWGYTGNAHYIGESSLAYQKLYETINAAFARGEEVWIEIDRTPVELSQENIKAINQMTKATIL
jgi:hypothetical protein